MEIPDFDLTAFANTLDEKRVAQGLTWQGVAVEIEEKFAAVNAATIKGAASRSTLEADGCLQMLLWLDRSPESFVPGTTIDTSHKLMAPAEGVLRIHLAEAYRLLDEARLTNTLSWQALAEAIGGFNAQGLKRFEKGGRAAFPAIMRVSQYLGLPLRELTRVSPW